MSYGLPYKGNKSAIADWIIEHLPRAETLVDLFCGGCAVTHAALVSGKYAHIIANDLHGDVPELFIDACHGKYTVDKCCEWVSREKFFMLKDVDAYIRLCWSFGNDGQTYIYGADVEPYKKILHEAVYADNVRERRLCFGRLMKLLKRRCVAMGENNEQLQRLQHIERLEDLERLEDTEGLDRITVSGLDYRDVVIPPDAVVYCDIPYDCTADNYGVAFDRAAFLDWADAQTAPVVISEYNISDGRFAVLAETVKRQLSGGQRRKRTLPNGCTCHAGSLSACGT